MKLLLAVLASQCSTADMASKSMSFIFLHAWRNFLACNVGKLPCDVIIVGQGHGIAELRGLFRGLPVRVVTGPATYHSGCANLAMELSAGYDHVVLCEHDSFIQPPSLVAIHDFLVRNPDPWFLTADTMRRSWWGFQGGFCTDLVERPWSMMPASTGLVVLSRSIYLNAIVRLRRDFGISCSVPFGSNTFAYGRACEIARGNCRHQELYSLPIGLDGPFSVDFFTLMHTVGTTPGKIVDNGGGSLDNKMGVMGLKAIKEFARFDSTRDLAGKTSDIVSTQHVEAPFFHMGGGHVVSSLVTYISDEHWRAAFGSLVQLEAGTTHYCLAELLVRNAGGKFLQDFVATKNRLFRLLAIDVGKYSKAYRDVVEFYSVPMKGYLKEGLQ